MNGKSDKVEIIDIPEGVGEADVIEYYIKKRLAEKGEPDKEKIQDQSLEK